MGGIITKKLLLTSIAALFLATGTANAGCHEYYFRCDNKLVYVQGCTNWSFSEIISKEKGVDLPSHAFRMRVRGAPNAGLYFRGQKCSCLNALMGQATSDECEEDQ
jgi:hypothetical protein